ncbi:MULTISPECIES: hypothetical protein [Henriciella]|jgi:hypothetical protein
MSEAKLNTEEARQGETGFGMRWVLIISTVAAIFGLGIAFGTMI